MIRSQDLIVGPEKICGFENLHDEIVSQSSFCPIDPIRMYKLYVGIQPGDILGIGGQSWDCNVDERFFHPVDRVGPDLGNNFVRFKKCKLT